MSTTELRNSLKKYNLVSNISKLKKDELIKILRAVKKYSSNKQTDFNNFYFGDKLVKLNEEQKLIVQAPLNQHNRIIACAGSGKTTTIICRIKYLIDCGVDPETIMLTTFNVDAAESMRNKLIEVFGFMPRITVGTIDSIACRFYHRYFKRNYKVSVSEYALYMLEYMNDPDNIIKSIYKHVFFDEFQDVNSTQYALLLKFYEYGLWLTVIGDDAQNIYQFRGSDVKYIINLESVIPELKTYKLVYNYRSTPEIIRLANSSIDLNVDQIKKQMIPVQKSIQRLPTVEFSNNSKDQFTKIFDQINYHLKSGIPHHEIAILSRNNIHLKSFEELLEKSNSRNLAIPYVALLTEDNDTKPKIKQNHITLTSIHKSKGLEWDVVFILGCDDFGFPSQVDNLSLQEERRLFYVATTRAKRFLNYYFTPIKDGKLTRFLQEVDISLYNFINYDKKYYEFNNSRTCKWITSVTETIRLINENDLLKMRKQGIIPTRDMVLDELNDKSSDITTEKIHKTHNVNQFITSYYLQPDFGEYIDRHITREIGRRKPESKGLLDKDCVVLISAQYFTKLELEIARKYTAHLKINIRKITNNKSCPNDRYIDLLETNDYELENIYPIDRKYTNPLIDFVNKLIIIAKKFNVDVVYLLDCISSKSDIPKSQQILFEQHYKKYTSDERSLDIKRSIYQTSLAKTILSGRRRLLYKDVSEHFTTNYDDFLDDTLVYIDRLEPEFNNLLCKRMVVNEDWDLYGEIDLIYNDTLIDFKCSSSNDFKLDWMLQLLTYTAMYRLEGHIVNNIQIYNALQGETYTIDVSQWNKEKELLEFLYDVRIRQIIRNVSTVDNQIFPIIYTTTNKEKNELILPKSKFTEEYLYDLTKIFGDSLGNYMINQLNKSSKLYKFNNKRYIVFDTETTGLPSPGSQYNNLRAFDSARMIQICWAIYENNNLLEVKDYYIYPNGFTKIDNTHIHHITFNDCIRHGVNINTVLDELLKDIKTVKFIVGHNVAFDINIVLSELFRAKKNTDDFGKMLTKCTMNLAIPLKIDGTLKRPKLVKLYKHLFGQEFDNQHNAKYDVLATGEIFNKLVEINITKI